MRVEFSPRSMGSPKYIKFVSRLRKILYIKKRSVRDGSWQPEIALPETISGVNEPFVILNVPCYVPPRRSDYPRPLASQVLATSPMIFNAKDQNTGNGRTGHDFCNLLGTARISYPID